MIIAAALASSLAVGVAVVLWATPPLLWQQDLDAEECCIDITHAGGLLNEVPYTNSLEALRANYAAGRRIFEVDLIETADGQTILAHDWDDFGGTPPTLAAYRASRPDITVLTFEAFVDWVISECGSCRVITDPKMPFEDFSKVLFQTVPSKLMRAQFVLQTYSFKEAIKLADDAPEQPQILTLYRVEEVSDRDLASVKDLPSLVAIAMPMDRLPFLAQSTRRITGKRVFTHGYPWMLRSRLLLKLARLFGATGFYKD